MTANEVIKLGKGIPFFTDSSWIGILGLTVMLSMLLSIQFVDNKKIYWLCMILFFPSLFGVIYLTITGIHHYEDDVKKWEEEVAYPYIHSLKEQKAFPMDVDLVGENSVALVFNDKDGIKRYINDYEIKATLSSGEKPYVVYKYLEQDLLGIEKGYYDSTIYVPFDYNF